MTVVILVAQLRGFSSERSKSLDGGDTATSEGTVVQFSCSVLSARDVEC